MILTAESGYAKTVHWRFDNDGRSDGDAASGSGSIRDEPGGAGPYPGTPLGGPYYRSDTPEFCRLERTPAAKSILSLEFNGIDETVTSPAMSIQNTNVTLETWVKFNRVDTQQTIIAFVGAWNSSILIDSSGYFRFQHDGGGTIISSEQAQVGIWCHIAGVIYGDQTKELFLNGVSIGAGSAYTNPPSWSWIVLGDRFGHHSGWPPSDVLDGFIDEARVTESALSPGEFLINTSAPKSIFWRFDLDGKPPGETASGAGSIKDGTDGTGPYTGDPLDGPLYSSDAAPTLMLEGTDGQGSTLSLQFDGTNDTVLREESIQIGDLTLEAWVKFFEVDRKQTIMALVYSYNLYLQIDGTGYFQLNSDAGGSVYSDIQAQTGVWYHVAGVVHCDGTKAFYLNGSLVGTAVSYTPSTLPVYDYVVLGDTFGHTQAKPPTDPLYGLIDEARVTESALSPGDFLIRADLNPLISASSGGSLEGTVYPTFVLGGGGDHIYSDVIHIENASADLALVLPFRTDLSTLSPVSITTYNSDPGGVLAERPPDAYWEWSAEPGGHDGSSPGDALDDGILDPGETISRLWKFRNPNSSSFSFWADVVPGPADSKILDPAIPWGRFFYTAGMLHRGVPMPSPSPFVIDDGTAEIYLGSSTPDFIVANRFTIERPLRIVGLGFEVCPSQAEISTDAIIWFDPSGEASLPEQGMEIRREPITLDSCGFHTVEITPPLVLEPLGTHGILFAGIEDRSGNVLTLGVDLDSAAGRTALSRDGGGSFQPVSDHPIVNGNAMIRLQVEEVLASCNVFRRIPPGRAALLPMMFFVLLFAAALGIKRI